MPRDGDGTADAVNGASGVAAACGSPLDRRAWFVEASTAVVEAVSFEDSTTRSSVRVSTAGLPGGRATGGAAGAQATRVSRPAPTSIAAAPAVAQLRWARSTLMARAIR